MTVAILFSPQGAQGVGMGRELAEVSPAAAETFLAADRALGCDLSGLCWHGPRQRLDDTRQTQPCLLTASVAAYRALRERAPVRPARVAGHSVGEYGALVAAGVLRFEDAVRIVARRGELMAGAAGSGGMAAVLGLDRGTVAETLDRLGPTADIVVANDNAPGQIVVSGTVGALEAARKALLVAGARRVIPLNVSGAFHSPRMAPVGEALGRAFDEVEWADADPPVVSNVTGEPLVNAELVRAALARQVASPVEWVKGVERMAADGVDTFVECGPGGVLAGLVRRIVPEARVFSVQDAATLDEALGALRASPLAA